MSIVPTNKRRDADIMALKMEDFKVENVNDSNTDFHVELKGPQGSLYQDGVWTVHVKFPADYPYQPPAMNFVNKIYHPNIDEKNGKICLNILNRDWSSLFALASIFTICLPHLLLYPNAEDPLNGEAGALMLRDKNAYEEKVKEYCLKYAQPANFALEQDEEGSKQEGESSEGTSDNVSASGDEGTAGSADP